MIVERELAMTYGRSAVGVLHRVIRAPSPIRLELEALVTWRDAHGERYADSYPAMSTTDDGFVFESTFRVRGPGFEPTGEWYRGVWYRAEASRGLNATEDLFCAGRFVTVVHPGETVEVEAWIGPDAEPPPPAADVVAAARRRAELLSVRAGAIDEVDALLAHAAKIDATRLRTQCAFFHQAHAEPVEAEVERGRAARDTAADDGDINAKTLGHGRLVSRFASSLRYGQLFNHGIGIGFTGGWPRRRPIEATSCRVSTARSSAAVRPHIRP